MAAGDAQRVWFREMIERLLSQWHPGMSFDGLVQLRDELDAMLAGLERSGTFAPQCFNVQSVAMRVRAGRRMSAYAR
jgi:hypothetical protein